MPTPTWPAKGPEDVEFRQRHGRPYRTWLSIGAGAVGVFAAIAVLALRARAVMASLYLYPDLPEATRLAAALGGPGAVRLNSQTALVPFTMDRLLAAAPFHRLLWQCVGPVLWVATVATVAVAVRRLRGWLPALMAAALLVCLPPIFLWSTLYADGHVISFLATALLGAHIVRLVQSDGGRCVLVRTAAVGLFTGLALTSDPEVWVSAVLPVALLALGVAVIGRQTRLRIAGLLLLTVVIAFTTWLATSALLTVRGVLASGPLAPPQLTRRGVVDGLRTIRSTLGLMVDGGWYTNSADALSLSFAIAALISLAVLVIGFRRIFDGVRNHDQLAVAAHAAFWLLSAAGLAGALLISGYGSVSALSGHYLNGCLLSAAAILPLSAMRGRVALAGALVLAAGARSAVGIANLPIPLFAGPDYADIPAMARTLTAAHLVRGYGGFWDSPGLEWQMNDSASVPPVVTTCRTGFCPYFYSADEWYRPQSGNSFLLLRDPQSCTPGDPFCIVVPPASLGPPTLVIYEGNLRALVYTYDIGVKLSPPT